jgi:hypothetical protein
LLLLSFVRFHSETRKLADEVAYDTECGSDAKAYLIVDGKPCPSRFFRGTQGGVEGNFPCEPYARSCYEIFRLDIHCGIEIRLIDQRDGFSP